MRRIAIIALLLAPAAAFAQSPGADPSSRALQQTVNELTQAWVGARTAYLQAQDQIIVKDAKIKELEDKLPRQTPIPGPSTHANDP